MTMRLNSKRGLSEVIGTIVLVLLTVVALTVISAFIIPFVKNKLNEGDSCFNVLNKVTINSEKSCYNTTSTEVWVRFGNIDLDEIYLTLELGDSINQYRIKEASKNKNINSGANLTLPDSGGG